jgi:hypothetical protein
MESEGGLKGLIETLMVDWGDRLGVLFPLALVGLLALYLAVLVLGYLRVSQVGIDEEVAGHGGPAQALALPRLPDGGVRAPAGVPYCPVDALQYPLGARFCTVCERDLELECSNCGATLSAADTSCYRCGKPTGVRMELT